MIKRVHRCAFILLRNLWENRAQFFFLHTLPPYYLLLQSLLRPVCSVLSCWDDLEFGIHSRELRKRLVDSSRLSQFCNAALQISRQQTRAVTSLGLQKLSPTSDRPKAQTQDEVLRWKVVVRPAHFSQCNFFDIHWNEHASFSTCLNSTCTFLNMLHFNILYISTCIVSTSKFFNIHFFNKQLFQHKHYFNIHYFNIHIISTYIFST